MADHRVIGSHRHILRQPGTAPSRKSLREHLCTTSAGLVSLYESNGSWKLSTKASSWSRALLCSFLYVSCTPSTRACDWWSYCQTEGGESGGGSLGVKDDVCIALSTADRKCAHSCAERQLVMCGIEFIFRGFFYISVGSQSTFSRLWS